MSNLTHPLRVEWAEKALCNVSSLKLHKKNKLHSNNCSKFVFR